MTEASMTTPADQWTPERLRAWAADIGAVAASELDALLFGQAADIALRLAQSQQREARLREALRAIAAGGHWSGANMIARARAALSPADTATDKAGDATDCSALPIVAAREAACREPYHWDDGVPYCDKCGLFRSSVRATPQHGDTGC